MMTPEQFCYWLQGYLEMSNPETLSNKQVKMLREHLNLVFTKVTHESDDISAQSDDGVTARPQPTAQVWDKPTVATSSPLKGTVPVSDDEQKRILDEMLRPMSQEEWDKIDTSELRKKIRESMKKNKPRDFYPRVHCSHRLYC